MIQELSFLLSGRVYNNTTINALQTNTHKHMRYNISNVDDIFHKSSHPGLDSSPFIYYFLYSDCHVFHSLLLHERSLQIEE